VLTGIFRCTSSRLMFNAQQTCIHGYRGKGAERTGRQLVSLSRSSSFILFPCYVAVAATYMTAGQITTTLA